MQQPPTGSSPNAIERRHEEQQHRDLRAEIPVIPSILAIPSTFQGFEGIDGIEEMGVPSILSIPRIRQFLHV